MNSKLKATSLLMAILCLSVASPISFAYPNEFPGKGNRSDFDKSCQICKQAVTLNRQGKKQESLELFKKAVANYPYSPIFHFNLGLGYSQLNDLRSALNSFNTAIRLAPDFGDAYSNLSDVHFKLGDYRSAEQTAVKATNLEEKSPVAWINLAQAELALSKAKQAKEHLQIAKGLPNADKYAADFEQLNARLRSSYSKTAEN